MSRPSIGEKIAIARDMHAKWGSALRADAALSGMLAELAAQAEASAGMCVSSGVAETCGRCDRVEGGSCCGAGIENRYTPEMLLINLLLGATLPVARRAPGSCYFLGAGGCVLPARDVLCINYLCARLQREIAREKLFRLQEANGREMDALFVLHDSVRKYLRRKSS